MEKEPPPLKVGSHAVDVYLTELKCPEEGCPGMQATGHKSKDGNLHTNVCAKCERVTQMAKPYPIQWLIKKGAELPEELKATLSKPVPDEQARFLGPLR